MTLIPESRRGGAGIALGFLSLLLGGCMASSPTGRSGDAAPGDGIGRFEVSSAAVSRGVIVPTRCEAGDHENFLGGDLRDDSLGITVRLVVDPLYGPALRVYDTSAPFERAVLFFEEECERFEMRLDRAGFRVDNASVRDLELEVDCENEDGATIFGRAAARCN